MAGIDYKKSTEFMNSMRAKLHGNMRLSFDMGPSYIEKQVQRFGADFADSASVLQKEATEKKLQQIYTDFAKEIKNVLPSKEYELLENIPVGVFPIGQDAATWFSKDSNCAFIAIDHGLMRTIYTMTGITLMGLKKKMNAESMNTTAQLLLRACASHLTGGAIPIPSLFNTELDESLMYMCIHMTLTQEKLVLAHEYAHHILGHFKDDSTKLEPFPKVPELDFKGLNIADVINNAENQMKELEADKKAFEIMFDYIKNRSSSIFSASDFSSIEIAALPLFFLNMTSFMWISYHFIIKDEDMKKKFIALQFAQKHPPSVMRKKAFYDSFINNMDEESRRLAGSLSAVHEDIIKEIKRLQG